MSASLPFSYTRRVPGSKLRVLVINDNTDATYYAYFHSLLDTLADEGRVSFFVLDRKAFEGRRPSPTAFVTAASGLIDPQVAIFNRYALPFGRALAKSLKLRGIRVLYHIDDDLLHVPPALASVPSFHHDSEKVVEERRAMLLEADAVQPSTEELAGVLASTLPASHVIAPMPPPYIPLEVPDLNPCEESAHPPVIGYVASKSHAADLAMIVPALVSLLKKRENLSFELFGTLSMPSELAAFGDRARSRPPEASYPAFLRTLGSLHWTVGLAPLVNSPFNRCKSAIKFLEYTACGIPVIASSGPTYGRVLRHKQNGLSAAELADWVQAMDWMLDNRGARINFVRQARHDCAAAFNAVEAKKQLLATLSTLAAGRGFSICRLADRLIAPLSAWR